MDNKNIFAANLKRLMQQSGKTRKDVCKDLGFSYYTFSDWVNGKKYPRMDKVELLAIYFGVLKSDLIEEKPVEHREMQKKNNAVADIVLKLRTDNNYFSLCEDISRLNPEQLASVRQIVAMLLKA